MSKYSIGDSVWFAGWEQLEERIPCPDCFGKKRLTVILGDDSKVSIPCAGCATGYEGPRGYATHSKRKASVKQVVIDGLEINKDEERYRFDTCYSTEVENLFATKEEAEIRATELSEIENKKALERIYQKDKNNRTWAWHVHYYRRQRKEAIRNVEFYSEKLGIAKEKTQAAQAKED